MFRSEEYMYMFENIDLLENLYANLKAGKYLMRLLKKRCGSKGAGNANLTDKLVATAPFSINFRVK
jgi:hypothetical protein